MGERHTRSTGRARVRDRCDSDAMTHADDANLSTLFLAGDVMTGRGIDQILRHPGNPRLHEPYLKNAVDYISIAEKVNGPIPRPVEPSYVWGEALQKLRRVKPDAAIVNLETAVTGSDDYWKGKGIHYRMHPENIDCIRTAKIDCCSLANNHVLDWGYAGLAETLATLHGAGIKTAGAGEHDAAAAEPAILALSEGKRVLVFAFGSGDSGIPDVWAASKNTAGVNRLADLSEETALDIATSVRHPRRPGDIVVASIHWGGNWGYGISRDQRRFAHLLIDEGGVDIIHGHSSHHAKGIEVYKRRPILYGCGDFINDYEGIRGYEEFRSHLGLMYFVSVNVENGELARLQMTPTRMRRFQVRRASEIDTQWLVDVLNREGRKLGTRVERSPDHTLHLVWAS